MDPMKPSKVQNLTMYIAVFALAAADIASGAVHCVGSTVELAAALESARQSTESDEVRIKLGEYMWDGVFFHAPNNEDTATGSLTVRGGYGEACSEYQLDGTSSPALVPLVSGKSGTTG